MNTTTERGFALLAAGLLLAGCGPRMDVTISFAAAVGDEPFACGTTFEDFGSGDGDFEARDLRFFVSEIELIDAEGAPAAFTPTDDGASQADGVALLDFEDASGGAAPATRAPTMPSRAPSPRASTRAWRSPWASPRT